METKNRFSVIKREITLPQVKQRTGIIIFLESYARVASFSLLSCESFVTLEQDWWRHGVQILSSFIRRPRRP